MSFVSRRVLTKQLQRIFWVYLTNNFIITSPEELAAVQASNSYSLVPISRENWIRVTDFRDKELIVEYQTKLAHNEIGFFAEVNGKAVGSIWATLNREQRPVVVRGYIKLIPREALIHDIVTGKQFRGLGVGPFMVAKLSEILLREYASARIIVDVNVRNHPSMRMMQKAGLRPKQQVLYVSVFGRLLAHRILKEF